nr:MAG TPA: hypothetical protein [Caudoviricetes sp.]
MMSHFYLDGRIPVVRIRKSDSRISTEQTADGVCAPVPQKRNAGSLCTVKHFPVGSQSLYFQRHVKFFRLGRSEGKHGEIKPATARILVAYLPSNRIVGCGICVTVTGSHIQRAKMTAYRHPYRFHRGRERIFHGNHGTAYYALHLQFLTRSHILVHLKRKILPESFSYFLRSIFHAFHTSSGTAVSQEVHMMRSILHVQGKGRRKRNGVRLHLLAVHVIPIGEGSGQLGQHAGT